MDYLSLRLDKQTKRHQYQSCMKLLLPSGPDETLKYDAYHPAHCNAQSATHHHPFHDHMERNNHRTGKGAIGSSDETHGYRARERTRIENIEWIKQYKNIPDTNIYVDAFECYPKIEHIHRRNQHLTNAHEVLMNQDHQSEQIVFILTHFHWDNYRGLESNHHLIFNVQKNNILYCSEITANILRYKIPDFPVQYMKILALNQTTVITEALPSNKKISVLAADSGHVYGSILCLFSISARHTLFDAHELHHLHTGDLNIDIHQHSPLKQTLQPYRGKIEHLWIDTKCLSYWLDPVCHRDCVEMVCQILDDCIPKCVELDSNILINIGKYTLGLEHALVEIAKHLKHEYNVRLFMEHQCDMDLIAMGDAKARQYADLHEYMHTQSQWDANKDNIKQQYLDALQAYRQHNGISESTSENKEMENAKTHTHQNNVCSYCKQLHSNYVTIQGETYFVDACDEDEWKTPQSTLEATATATATTNDNPVNPEFEQAPTYYYDNVRVQTMNMNLITFQRMRFALKKYAMVIGVVMSSKCQRFEVEINEDRRMMIYYVPHKEHCNRQELRSWIKFLKPRQRIYALHDNFDQQSVQRQAYQLAYNIDELFRQPFLVQNPLYLAALNTQSASARGNEKRRHDHEWQYHFNENLHSLKPQYKPAQRHNEFICFKQKQIAFEQQQGKQIETVSADQTNAVR